jgi:hypothetical protein
MGKVDVALALAVKLRERLLQGFAPATCEWRACQVSDTLPMAHVYLVDSTVRGAIIPTLCGTTGRAPERGGRGSGASAALW